MVVWKGDWHQIVDPGTTVNFDDGSVAIGLDLKISINLPGMADANITDDELPGAPSDYGWGPTLDGSGMVVWKGDWHQIFERGAIVTFSADSRELVADSYGTIVLREPGASYPGAADLPGVKMGDFSYTLSDDLKTWTMSDGATSKEIKAGQIFRFDDVTIKIGPDGGFTHEYGAPVQAPVTHFGIDGASGEFGWGPTEDGTALVIWKGENFHIFDRGVELTFDDGALTIDAAGAITFAATPAIAVAAEASQPVDIATAADFDYSDFAPIDHMGISDIYVEAPHADHTIG